MSLISESSFSILNLFFYDYFFFLKLLCHCHRLSCFSPFVQLRFFDCPLECMHAFWHEDQCQLVFFIQFSTELVSRVWRWWNSESTMNCLFEVDSVMTAYTSFLLPYVTLMKRSFLSVFIHAIYLCSTCPGCSELHTLPWHKRTVFKNW